MQVARSFEVLAENQEEGRSFSGEKIFMPKRRIESRKRVDGWTDGPQPTAAPWRRAAPYRPASAVVSSDADAHAKYMLYMYVMPMPFVTITVRQRTLQPALIVP